MLRTNKRININGFDAAADWHLIIQVKHKFVYIVNNSIFVDLLFSQQLN